MDNQQFDQALSLHRQGRLAQAQELYCRILDSNPKHAGALNNLALIVQSRGQIEAAYRLLLSAVQQEPRQADFQANLARVCHALGRLDECVACYRAAMALDPKNARLQTGLANVSSQTGNLQEAEALYLEVISQGAAEFDVHYNLGVVYLRLNRLDDARRQFNMAADYRPDDIETLNQLIEVCLLQDQLSAAEAVMERAQSMGGFNTRLQSLRAVVFNRQRDSAALESLYDYHSLLRVTPVNLDPAYTSAEEFNRRLIECLDNRVVMYPSPPGKATVSGLHSARITSIDEPVMQEMNRQIMAAYQAMLDSRPAGRSHPFWRAVPDRVSLDSWTVRLRQGGYQRPHIHPRAWLSGCYYVQVPEVVRLSSSGSGRGGWIEFGRPDDKFKVADPLALSDYQPRAGELVTFPSYYWHNTIPFSADQERISLAFDLCPA